MQVQILSEKMQYRWKDHLKVVLFKIGKTHTLVMMLGAGLSDASSSLGGLLASSNMLRCVLYCPWTSFAECVTNNKSSRQGYSLIDSDML